MHFCKKNNLAFTGGSDFHNGNQSKSEIGNPKVSYSAVESLKDKIARSAQQTLQL
jgi:hypothetical protein